MCKLTQNWSVMQCRIRDNNHDTMILITLSFHSQLTFQTKKSGHKIQIDRIVLFSG